MTCTSDSAGTLLLMESVLVYEQQVVVTEFAGTDKASTERLINFAEEINPLTVVAVTSVLDDERRRLFSDPGRAPANVSVLELGVALGKGASLRAAMGKVTQPYVAFVVPDPQLEAATVIDALDRLAATPDLDGIVWNRYADVDDARSAIVRRLRSGVCNGIARTLFGLSTLDVHSPLKTFRRGALLRLLDDLLLYNHGFDTDLLYNAKRLGLVIVEYPLRWTPRAARTGFVRSALEAGLAIVALRAYHSPLRNLPMVSILSARYTLPVRRTYSIAIFCWRDPYSPKAGGGEVYLHEQAKCWARRGCCVTWVSERFAGSRREEEIDGIRFVRRGRGLFVFCGVPWWHIFESSRSYDFIIDVMNGVPFFTPLYSSKPKICLLFHVHSYHFREELPAPFAQLAVAIETKLVPLIYRRTRFVTISGSTKAEMENLGISKMPILTIHSGVSDTLVPGSKSPTPTILYVGRIRKYKRIRNLLYAFEALRKDIPNLSLTVAGEGDDQDALAQEARQRGIDNVTFTGRVDEATKTKLMQAAWVFAMPSQLEGWGIVVIEAAACGTPSVAYDVAGLRDCIREGRTGMLARNDAEFTAHLRSILTNDALRDRLSAGAVKWSRRFSWDRTAQRTLTQVRLAQPWRAVFESGENSTLDLRYHARRFSTPILEAKFDRPMGEIVKV